LNLSRRNLINIEIIKVEVVNSGKYSTANIMYKGPDGKPDGKKIVSFDKDSKNAYATLTGAQPGDFFDVKSEKVGNYWKWTDATATGKNVGGSVGGGSAKATQAPVRSSYETPEERAKRQVYIIRQSSISSAVELLKDPKKTPAADEVIAIAKEFEAYVLDTELAADEFELKEPEIA